jgi:xanthine dehydrogenase molybdenum-binding subunit
VPGESLLDALRERCGITSLKDGCQPQGQCGCCLALVDGRPLVTCAFTCWAGLPDRRRRPHGR